MFELLEKKALIRSINLRAESHGDETELGCDIGLEFSLHNRALDLLHEGLLPCLYTDDPTGATDAQVSLDIEPGTLPHLRFPLIDKFPWGYEGVGYTFELVEDALHGEQRMRLHDCKVNKIQIEPQEGGTVNLRVRVQGHPTQEMVGELSEYLKEYAVVSLIPPKVEDSPQGDFEDGAEAEAA